MSFVGVGVGDGGVYGGGGGGGVGAVGVAVGGFFFFLFHGCFVSLVSALPEVTVSSFYFFSFINVLPVFFLFFGVVWWPLR